MAPNHYFASKNTSADNFSNISAQTSFPELRKLPGTITSEVNNHTSTTPSLTISDGKGGELNVPDENAINFATTLQLWATISDTLWWTVLIICIISIPILCHALVLMLRRYKKSNYFHFLVFMIILDLVMVISIIFSVVSERAFAFKGNMTCKLTAFITNVTSCYSNWLWVMMFAQRFIHIFYPMHRIKANDGGTLFRIIDDTRQVILLTGIMASFAQLWTPFLMKEVMIYDESSDIAKGSYCGPDSTLINKDLFKWIAVAESVWTYAIPFLITVVTDVAVLFFSQDSKRFTTICAEEMLGGKLSVAKQFSNSRRPDAQNFVTASMCSKFEPQFAESTASFSLANNRSKSSAQQIFAATVPLINTSPALYSYKNLRQNSKNSVFRSSQNSREIAHGDDTCSNSAANNFANSQNVAIEKFEKKSSLNKSKNELSNLLEDKQTSVTGTLPQLQRQENGHYYNHQNYTQQNGLKQSNSDTHTKRKLSLWKMEKPLNTSKGTPMGVMDAIGVVHTVRAKSIPLKIQSEDSLRACHRRRQRAIRNCLLLATMQLLLNLPNYVLQLVDEFTDWRATSQRFAEFYLYADAFFYLLYLSQYPMMAVYVRWLHGNFAAPHVPSNLSATSSAYGGAIRSSSRINLFHGTNYSVGWPNGKTVTPVSTRRRLSSYHPPTTNAEDDEISLTTKSKSARSSVEASTARLSIANLNNAPEDGHETRPASASGQFPTIAKRHSTGGMLLSSERISLAN